MEDYNLMKMAFKVQFVHTVTTVANQTRFCKATAEAVAAGVAADSPDKVWDKLWKIWRGSLEKLSLERSQGHNLTELPRDTFQGCPRLF